MRMGKHRTDCTRVHKQLIIVNRALGKNVDNDLMKFDHYYRRARSYSEVADAKKE